MQYGIRGLNFRAYVAEWGRSLTTTTIEVEVQSMPTQAFYPQPYMPTVDPNAFYPNQPQIPYAPVALENSPLFPSKIHV